MTEYGEMPGQIQMISDKFLKYYKINKELIVWVTYQKSKEVEKYPEGKDSVSALQNIRWRIATSEVYLYYIKK